jgi:hypothetical protein
MDRLGSAEIILFEGSHLNRRSGCLLRLPQAGVASSAVIGSRALDLLGLLVSRWEIWSLNARSWGRTRLVGKRG